VAENIARGKRSQDEDVLSLNDLIKNKSASTTVKPFKYNYVQATDVESAGEKPSPVDDDIITAAKQANAHEFILSFPNGYDTEVGEGSIMVSGGQKQVNFYFIVVV